MRLTKKTFKKPFFMRCICYGNLGRFFKIHPQEMLDLGSDLVFEPTRKRAIGDLRHRLRLKKGTANDHTRMGKYEIIIREIKERKGSLNGKALPWKGREA